MNKTIMISMMALILLVVSVQALPQGAITINSPADNTWTNLVNYTSGFNFSVSDNEGDYTVNCSLYIGTEYNLPVIIATENTTYASQIVAQDTTTVFYMNHEFPTNNTVYYWAIKCFNNSHLPSVASDLRTLSQGTEVPTLAITSTSVTNDTFVTLPMRFEVLAVDNSTQGEAMTVSIRNTTGYSYASTSIYNGTKKNITWSPADGTYVVDLNVSNPAGNTAINDTRYTVYVDTTNPVISWNSPSAGAVTENEYQVLNWTMTEQNVDVILLNWSGTTETVDIGNCSGTAPNYECTFNKTGIVAGRNIAYGLIINDSAGNELETASRTINANITGVSIATFNWTIADSVATFRILITATTPESCKLDIYNNTGDKVTTVTGTLGTVGATTNCTGTFDASDILTDGAVRVEYNVTDGAGNSVVYNKTGVMNYLYTGWNVITYADTASDLMTICDEIASCTSVSWYNNSGQAFVTYSTSTPGTNNETDINPGDAIFVYVSADSSYLVNNNLPKSTDETRFITIYDMGWNTMGLIQNGNISAVYNVKANATGGQNITYTSLYKAETQKFYTCKSSSSTCAGTTESATNIDLPLGYAVWVLTDQNQNYTINRTEVSG